MRSAKPFRRTALVAGLALTTTLGTVMVPGFAGAEEEFINGSGRAKAAIVRVGPSAGQLSLAPSVGVALADHLTSLGRGEALIFDYAALDGSVNNSAGDMKRQFPPLRVESRDPAAAAGVRWEPKPGFVETGQATSSPVGRSAVAIEGFNLPGVIEMTGGKARAFSGVYFRTADDGTQHLIRAAGGTVDISRVSIGGNSLVLENLRWEAAQITDENDDETPEVIGGFTVGRVLASGQTQGQGLTQAELGQIFGPLNEQLLSQLGLFIEAPTLGATGGVATVSPLRIRIASNHFGPLAEGVQGIRNAPSPDENLNLSEWLIAQCVSFEGSSESSESGSTGGGGGGVGLPLGRPDPGVTAHGQAGGGAEREEFNEFASNGPDGPKGTPSHEPPAGSGSSDCGLPFLIADLAAAPVSGFGQLDIDLGGVLGVTEGTIFSGFDLFGNGGLDLGTGPIGSTSSTTSGLDDGTSVLGSTVGTGASPATTLPAAGTSTPQGGSGQLAAPQEYRLTGSRASAAWAVGLVGLGVALAMAASDYRRLRNRRRAVTPIT